LALDIVAGIARSLVPFGLIIALGLFGWLAIKGKSLRSLQVELSIFLVIWIVAELLRSLLLLGIIGGSTSLQLFGLEIHTISMVVFGILITIRVYRISTQSGAK
jgi:hypothetical protein